MGNQGIRASTGSRDGSAHAISDGSFKDKLGTAAFSILDAHE
jgi:hypothetical protein